MVVTIDQTGIGRGCGFDPGTSSLGLIQRHGDHDEGLIGE
jgi:hypothetical protein